MALAQSSETIIYEENQDFFGVLFCSGFLTACGPSAEQIRFNQYAKDCDAGRPSACIMMQEMIDASNRQADAYMQAGQFLQTQSFHDQMLMNPALR
jgi:hypothetical protein